MDLSRKPLSGLMILRSPRPRGRGGFKPLLADQEAAGMVPVREDGVDLSDNDIGIPTTNNSPRPRGRGGFKQILYYTTVFPYSPRPRGRGGFKRL